MSAIPPTEDLADDPAEDPTEDLEARVARLAALSRAQRPRRAPFVPQHSEMDCAAASLETVIQAYGKRAGLSRCRAAVRFGREGASLYDIQVAAESFGFACVGARVDFAEDIASLPLPLIVGGEHHFVVVTGFDRGRARLMDPAMGARWEPLAELTERSGGICLLLAPLPAFRQWEDHRSDASRYWQLARDNRRKLLAAFGCSLLLLALGTAGPWFSRWVFDDVIPLQDRSALVWVAAGYLAVIVLSRVGAIARQWIVTGLAFRIDRDLSTALYRRLFRLPLTELLRHTPGDISATLDEVSGIRQFITGQVVANLLEYLNLVVYLGMLFWISTKFAILTLLLAPAYAAIPVVLGPLLRRLRAVQLRAASRLETVLLEQVAGYRTIKALGAEEHARVRWEERLDAFLGQVRQSQRAVYPIRTAVDAFQSLVSLLCLVLAARWVIGGEITIGEMVAGTLLVSQVLDPISSIAEHWAELQEVRVSIDRVEDALAQPMEDPGGTANQAVSGDIHLDGVTYRYGPTDAPVLDALDLTLRAGEITALVGRSGSGKTTVAQLLNRLLVPESGAIHVGGVDMASVPLSVLRRDVGVALPEYHLFQGSVLENIAMGTDGPADPDRAEDACRHAQIHDFVAALPSGYETRIPEAGMGLSSGQKQRLCLARIFYRDPAVLVLDEVTSYLDQASETAILGHLREIQPHKTIVFITHRPNVLLYADRVVVLQGGAIHRDLRMGASAERRVASAEAVEIFETL